MKKQEKLGYLSPQNHENNKFFNHISATEIRELLNSNIWNEYFKFCFERNPWDKVISWYYGELKHGKQMTFEQFMDSGHFKKVKKGGIAFMQKKTKS